MGTGDLSAGGKAGIQRGLGNELPKPLLGHQMEGAACVWGRGGGSYVNPLFTQGLYVTG